MNPLCRALITAFLFFSIPVFLFAQAPGNDNCSGAITLVSGNTCSSTASTVQFATSSSLAGACGGATTTTTYDVWFTFQAVNAKTTINLNILGSRFTTNTPYIEVLSGASCSGFTSLNCQAAATSGITRVTLSSLTVGNFYYIRVYTLISPAASGANKWNFDICVQHQPVNDNCSGAITLTPGATCSNTAGTLDLATSNITGVVQSCWAANTYNDVWYKFTATGTTHTVNLSNMGANIATPRIQIYSGSCAGLTIVGCATASILTQAALTIGNTYFVRIANTTDPSGTGGVANFNICITNAAAPPVNDNCSGAISLTSSSSCSKIFGTLLNANVAGATTCGDANSADVWYSFVAQSGYPTIDLADYNFPNISGSTTPRIELFSGSCASLTSLGCSTDPFSVLTTVGGSGLTIGSTYYVRITTNKSTGVQTSGAWDFSICITNPTGSATIDYGKSYVNISKGTNGGTINPGDILELRATLVVGGSGKSIDSVAYYDTLKSGRGFSLVPGSISLRTNEGKLYKSYTDAINDDAGWYNTAGAGTDTIIQINMGIGASKSARGRINNTSKPSNFGSTCIVMATYRVVVNASYNTKINFGGGKFSYRDVTTGTLSAINFVSDSLIVYNSPGLCPNAVSPTNIVGDEYNGTFGTASGSPTLARNRGTSSNTNYIYAPFGPPTNGGGPNDYYYGIANNTSGNTYATANTYPKATLNSSIPQRVFGVWDITGDHTSATNTAKGNPPCDINQPVSPSNPCGYMLVVNSAYNTDTAFQYSVSNVCTNTYYEISAWFKNICYKCGCDSNGVSAISGTAGYIPFDAATKDSSGIQPNIAIALDGVDYYTTGNIPYAGIYPATNTGSDSTNRWVKKGFTYKTGPSQTSFVLTFRNNAPGGGGNDWAIDDIAMANCLPNMSYSPSQNPPVCDSNYIDIEDTIRSYFNTYADYLWQRSTDNGTTWSNISGTQGVGSPAWNGSAYQYIASYRIPTTATNLSDSGDLYRVVVGTTASNVSSPGCQNTDGVSIITLNVLNCYVPLNIDMLSFNGKLVTSHANLFWNTSKENEAVHFDIEKSTDGINFTKIGTVNGYTNYISEVNHYSFIDPSEFSGKAWYRIVMISNKGGKKYSQVIQLTNEQIYFGLNNIINPFKNELSFEVITTNNAKVDVSLIDLFGKIVKQKSYTVYSGVNSLSITNTQGLNSGIYILQVKNKDIVINSKVLKK